MSYSSVFSWRYGSREMRSLFGEEERRLQWRRVWVALARAQKKAGLLDSKELKGIESQAGKVRLEESLRIERQIRHDLVAELRVFASQCRKGGGKIHLGATSMDVEDNADVLMQISALRLVKARLRSLLSAFEARIRQHASTPCMAFTHLQRAEPTTLGYRLAQYAQDLLLDFEGLESLDLRGKGLKGAVGTAASYHRLLQGKKVSIEQLEEWFLRDLDLKAFEVTTQTAPRKQEYLLLAALASVAQSLHKFCFDVRLLQMLGQASEPFKEKQVGSSAMPFKRNPMTCERVCSLARLLPAYAQVAWENAAFNALERTLDDSANRRTTIPEAFLALDECLMQAEKVVRGLKVNEAALKRDLEAFGPFACVEPLLMRLVELGGDRQELHELLRGKCMQAWESVEKGEPNPLTGLLQADPRLHISEKELGRVMNVEKHAGFSKQRALAIARRIHAKARGEKARALTEGF